MTKRHATYLQRLYKQILVDLSTEMPELRHEFSRDYLRLCSALDNHGLRFFTIDLVEAGKHFDQCLSRSRLSKFDGPHMRPFKRGGVIPRLFRGLLLRVFQSDGLLAPTCDHNAVRALRQLYYCSKKLKLECENVRTFETVRKFIQVEAALRSPVRGWNTSWEFHPSAGNLRFDDGDYPSSGRNNQLELFPRGFEKRLPNGFADILHGVADIISASIGVIDPTTRRCKHGPGAVSDLRRKSKYEFPIWPDRLEKVFPMADFAYANYGLWADDLLNDQQCGRFRDCEPTSKLIAVPKTQKGPRLIASEPTAHQWIQQLLKGAIDDRVSATWLSKFVHFRDQTFNQRLARQASLSGSHWTVDLSDASDRLSCWVVERFFRKNETLLTQFYSCRTRILRQSIDPTLQKYILLKKFSTMGSALTFPVQTLVFLGCAIACVLYARKQRASIRNIVNLKGEVLVFGDDIIIPSDAGYLFQGLMGHLDFKVNRNKTFGTGKFRESCGGEYFDGHDVTPIYFLTLPDRGRPESIGSSVAVRNNFLQGGYSNCADYLKRTIVSVARLKLPTLPFGSGLLCWDTFGVADVQGLRSKFCPFTHRRLIRAHSLRVKQRIGPDRETSRYLQYFTEDPAPTSLWKSGYREVPKVSLDLRWVPLP